MKKILSAAVCAAILLASVAGCSSEDAEQGKNNVIVASVENPPEDAGDTLNVYFSDWEAEYLFNLANQGLEDTEENAEVCAQYRSNVINYQISDKMMLYVAKKFGIDAATLTDEEIDEINRTVETTYEQWRANFETQAIEELEEGYSDQQLKDKEQELFEAFLADCNLTPEIFVVWETNSAIQDKLAASYLEQNPITDERVAEFVQETVDAAKNAYENDLATFEASYTPFYVPEGTRIVEQIFFKLDDETVNEITAYRKDGDDETADRLLEEALVPLDIEVSAAQLELANGTSWDDVQEKYNDDTSGNDATFTVYPTSSYIAKEITEAALAIPEIGGVSELIKIDSGYFLLYYVEDATFSEEQQQSLNDQAREYLEESDFSDFMIEWHDKYPFVVDYEAINLTDPAAAATTSAETAASETTAAETSAEETEAETTE